MTHLTIREAAQLIGRTSATIRRYIRSGRLKAEKESGKFGEEYRIRRDDLLALGFSPVEPGNGSHLPVVRARAMAPIALPEAVPVALYNELLMKHEQILVQYGMIRAGGQKLFEYKADAEAKAEEIRREKDRYQSLRQRALKEIGLLRKKLREMEIQLEEQKIEITLLQEMARRADSPGAVRPAGDSIAATLLELRHQERTVAELAAEDSRRVVPSAAGDPWVPGFPPLDRHEDH